MGRKRVNLISGEEEMRERKAGHDDIKAGKRELRRRKTKHMEELGRKKRTQMKKK